MEVSTLDGFNVKVGDNDESYGTFLSRCAIYLLLTSLGYSTFLTF